MNLKALVPFRDRQTLARPELNVFGPLQREVDRLHGAGCLLGECDAEIFHFLLIAFNRLLTKVPDRKPGGGDSDEDDCRADQPDNTV